MRQLFLFFPNLFCSYFRRGHINCWLIIRVGNSLIGFWVNHIFLWTAINSLRKKELFAHSFFCHEQPERIAHYHSFVKSDVSNSLTVALLFSATWVIHSHCSYKKEQMCEVRQEWYDNWSEKGWKTILFKFIQANFSFFYGILSEKTSNSLFCSFVIINMSESLTVALV